MLKISPKKVKWTWLDTKPNSSTTLKQFNISITQTSIRNYKAEIPKSLSFIYQLVLTFKVFLVSVICKLSLCSLFFFWLAQSTPWAFQRDRNFYWQGVAYFVGPCFSVLTYLVRDLSQMKKWFLEFRRCEELVEAVQHDV